MDNMASLDIHAQEVLSTMFGADESVCIRIFSDRKDANFPGTKFKVPCGGFATQEEALHRHNALNRGIFFVVNYGGQTDEEITRVNAQFVEMDEGTFEEQWEKILILRTLFQSGRLCAPWDYTLKLARNSQPLCFQGI